MGHIFYEKLVQIWIREACNVIYFYKVKQRLLEDIIVSCQLLHFGTDFLALKRFNTIHV